MTSGVKGSGRKRRTTTITISPELHDAIEKRGAKPDTFEVILWRALAALEEVENSRR